MKRMLLLLIPAALLAAETVQASTLQVCPIVPPEQWMKKEKVEPILAGLGYKVIYVQPDGGCWSALAEKDGYRWEVYIHPKTGKVVRLDRRQG